MPPKSKNNKEYTTNASSKQLTGFALYTNATGQIPQIVVNLVNQCKYIESINSLRQILSFKENRKNNLLIEFKVRSHDKIGICKTILPTFYIQSSSLYIIGYKTNDQIRIFEDSENLQNRYSLKYPNQDTYSFFSINIAPKDSPDKVKENLNSLYTVAWMVSETLRQPEFLSQKIISALIQNQQHQLHVDQSVIQVNEIKETSEHECIQQLLTDLESIKRQCTLSKWKSNWEGKTVIVRESLKDDGEEAITERYNEAKLNFLKQFNTHFIQSYALMMVADHILEDILKESKLILDETSVTVLTQISDIISKSNGEVLTLKNNLWQYQTKLKEELDFWYENEQLINVFLAVEEIDNLNILEYTTTHQDMFNNYGNKMLYILAMRNIINVAEITQEIQKITHTVQGIALDLKESAKTGIESLSKHPNGTSAIIHIEEGRYQENPFNPGKYSKIPGSERLTFHYSYSDDKPNDDDKGREAIRINPSSKEDDVISVTISTLSYYLSWLSSLPQWLQDQILNSTPVKTLIEVAKQDSAIYEPKSAAKDFYDRSLSADQEKSQNDFTEDTTSEKAQVDDSASLAGMIDMAMILSGAAVSYLILPTIIESVPLSGKDNFFTGETGLNLLNGIEIF
jgi:hypothetical protein